MEVFKSMEKDGVELNLSMLNLLINAFGVAGRHIEAFSVFDYILEVVSLIYMTIVESLLLEDIIRSSSKMWCYLFRELVSALSLQRLVYWIAEYLLC